MQADLVAAWPGVRPVVFGHVGKPVLAYRQAMAGFAQMGALSRRTSDPATASRPDGRA